MSELESDGIDQMKMPDVVKLLTDRNFRTYFIADAFHDLGVDVRLVAMGWWCLSQPTLSFGSAS